MQSKSVRTDMRLLKVTMTILVLLVTTCMHTHAQVQVRSGFIPDSVVVGDEAAYYLTATYPKNLQVLFPDSTFSFTPFEFQKKKYFATETLDSLSYDSAVYTLSTFEVDLVQYLQLPVYLLHAKDCTTFLATRDSVMLKELVTFPLPDTLKAENLPLISNTAYEPVDWFLNYPLLLIIGGVLLVIILVSWIIFGKRIRKHFVLKRLQKEHAHFILSFNQRVEVLKQTFTAQEAERILFLWKKYMESLDSKPYTKLTTKETAVLLQDSVLGEQLRTVDAAVYGRNTHVEDSFFHLRDYAVTLFQQKLDKVSHG